jgi:hypothetical protein
MISLARILTALLMISGIASAKPKLTPKPARDASGKQPAHDPDEAPGGGFPMAMCETMTLGYLHKGQAPASLEKTAKGCLVTLPDHNRYCAWILGGKLWGACPDTREGRVRFSDAECAADLDVMRKACESCHADKESRK